MLQYSKHAHTRYTNLDDKDVAIGYIEMANKVLIGQIQVHGDKEEQEKEFEKARRILANLRGSRA